MAQPIMFPLSSPASLQASMDPEPRQEPPSTPKTSETTPSVEKTEVECTPCLRNSFAKYNILRNVGNIPLASWQSGTQKQCKTYIEEKLKVAVTGKLIVIHYKSVKLWISQPAHMKNTLATPLNTARSEESTPKAGTNTK